MPLTRMMLEVWTVRLYLFFMGKIFIIFVLFLSIAKIVYGKEAAQLRSSSVEAFDNITVVKLTRYKKLILVGDHKCSQ